MDKKEKQLRSETTPAEHLGPAMRALNERQRKFVTAMVVFGGSQVEAYKYAGYEVTNDNSAAASASRLANSDAVQAAIAEEQPRRLKAGAPIAAEILFKMANGEIDLDNKTRLAAVNSYLDRSGISTKTIQEHIVTHEHSMEELMDIIRQNAQVAGPEAMKLLGLSDPVDAEYEDVPSSTAGIEEIF